MSSVYSHSQHCHLLMSSHSRASPTVMVLSQPQPQQVTARFSSFNQGSTLSTDISPPFSALLRIPSLIALSLSLILVFLSLTGYSLSEKTVKVKNYFHFFSLFFRVVSRWAARSYGRGPGGRSPFCQGLLTGAEAHNHHKDQNCKEHRSTKLPLF